MFIVRIMGNIGRCMVKYSFLILLQVVCIFNIALRNVNVYVFT
jgi:hypothetical protein